MSRASALKIPSGGSGACSGCTNQDCAKRMAAMLEVGEPETRSISTGALVSRQSDSDLFAFGFVALSAQEIGHV